MGASADHKQRHQSERLRAKEGSGGPTEGTNIGFDKGPTLIAPDRPIYI